MNLSFSSAEEAFRQDVRAFFRTDYPASVIEKVRQGVMISREDHVLAQQALQARGWLAAAWPPEHGGPGWTPIERHIFEEEAELAGMAPLSPMGLIYIGPIICAFGTPEQQRRWLPDILESRTFWAQGYSEPEAGSDLASLSMTATRQHDHYILDGTKIWTSYAHYADWIFCLVRTSREDRRQDGLSLVCADMKTAGIAVHPIVTMDGEHHLNRVTFNQVRVPLENRIGEEGRGWHYATRLLQNERLSYAHLGRKKADLAQLRQDAERSGAAHDPAFMSRLAQAEMDLKILEMSVVRIVAGHPDPAAVSALKIHCTEAEQRIAELKHLFALTYGAEEGGGEKEARDYVFSRAATIYGGSTEIQKTIIWRHLSRSQ